MKQEPTVPLPLFDAATSGVTAAATFASARASTRSSTSGATAAATAPPAQVAVPVPARSDECQRADRQRLPPAFAVLHIADFALQAILRLTPDLAERPVALLESERKRALVLAATAAAQAEGVTPGLTAPQAQARCADLLVRTRQPAAEAEAHAALLAAAGTLSPLIEATAPGVATADVSALPVAQREPAIRAALTQLTTLGLPATGGLAATPLLALYAARTLSLSSSSFSFSSSSAPVVTPSSSTATGTERKRKEKEKEERQYIVVTDTRAFLAPLPLATADPPPEIAPILTAWGLRTLGDLTALTKADIVQRLGPAGLALWERAAGETTRPLHPVTPTLTFAAELELEEAVETLEPLLFLLRRFVDRLTLELQAAGFVAAELQLTLTLEDETEHARSFRLPEPTADSDVLFRTLHSHLETLTTASAVAAVRLTLEPARPLARQHGLFDTGLRDPHGFGETLARTVAVVGSGRVGTPQNENTHRPDAVSLTPPASIVPPAAPPEVLAPLGLPLRRFRPPLPAKVELSAGPAEWHGRDARGRRDSSRRNSAKAEAPNHGRPAHATGKPMGGTPMPHQTAEPMGETPMPHQTAEPMGGTPMPRQSAEPTGGTPVPPRSVSAYPLHFHLKLARRAPGGAPEPRHIASFDAPAYVWTERLQGAVTAVRGPWRGSGDWWQPELRWEREEWDVELAGGGLYRVVRTPAGWWLEGEYD